MLDAGCWMLDAGLWTLDTTLWTLGSGHCTQDNFVDCCRTESTPSFWFFLIKLLKILCESLRTSWSRLFCRDYRFWSCLYKNAKRGFYCEKPNYITSSYPGLFRSSRSQSSIFQKIYPGNTGGRVLLLVKLRTGCSEYRLYTKMTLPRMFSWKSSESFWSA